MSAFEDAVRKLFKAPPDAVVYAEITGGGEVQIGDCTWDTEPTEIEVSVTTPDHNFGTRKFDTLSELFDALLKEDTDPIRNMITAVSTALEDAMTHLSVEDEPAKPRRPRLKKGDVVRYTGSYAPEVPEHAKYGDGVVDRFREYGTKVTVRLIRESREAGEDRYADWPVDETEIVQKAPGKRR